MPELASEGGLLCRVKAVGCPSLMFGLHLNKHVQEIISGISI